jgi:hypothetical protein
MNSGKDRGGVDILANVWRVASVSVRIGTVK